MRFPQPSSLTLRQLALTKLPATVRDNQLATSSMADIVVPGDALGPAGAFASGEGTHVRDGTVYASILGRKSVEPAVDATGRPFISVSRGVPMAPLPEAGDIVMARITSITHLIAGAEILVVNDVPLAVPAAAVIRKEHVRESEIDKVC